MLRICYRRALTVLDTGGLQRSLKATGRKNSIHDILVNEKYSGTYIFNRCASKNTDGKRNNHASKSEEEVIRIPGGIPAIISKEDFQKVQEKMQRNKKRASAYRAIDEKTLAKILSSFRQFVKERNIQEVKKFIHQYVDKVLVYEDHVKVVFKLYIIVAIFGGGEP
jgi:Recombinase.